MSSNADIFSGVGHDCMITGVVDINTTTVTAVKVGTANLSSRKWLVIRNASDVKCYVGSKSDPTTIATRQVIAKTGWKLDLDEVLWLPVDENITVYAISNSGAGKRLRITEIA